jgi:Rod binding domain-containing protein
MADAFALSAPGLQPIDVAKANMASAAAAGSTLSAGTKAKAKAAAQNFEAVFLNSMFEQMYTGIDGDGPFGGSGATGVWRSFLTDEYAKSFAKAGGIGIASHVYNTLIAQQEAH